MNIASLVTGVGMGAANAAPAPSPFLVPRHPSRLPSRSGAPAGAGLAAPERSADGRRACRAGAERRRAFTLVEMLVVIAIMGLLAALAVPALKNFGHSDAMTAAAQQMLDDVGRARQLAISEHTTVYMVFVPADFWGNMNAAQLAMPATTNLCGEQMVGYTFMAYGALGDQPGQHNWHYLAQWQTLPDGTFIDTNKFNLPGTPVSSSNFGMAPPVFSQWNQDYPHSDQNTIYAFTNLAVPFPTEDSPALSLPCIAFNYLGQLTFDGQTMASRHEYIPLARGSVSPSIDPVSRVLQLNPPQVSELPPGNSTNTYNIIDIDPLTGRATAEQPKIR